MNQNTPDYAAEKQLRDCSDKQLKRRPDERNMSEWNEWRRKERPGTKINLRGAKLAGGWYCGADFSEVCFEEADFREASCENAQFWGACCKKAKFWGTNCKGANFGGANCEDAWFLRANCEGASFRDANCKGTWFRYADFDPKSNFFECTVSEKTDFRLTNLDAIKIEPDKKAYLERTIRRLNWEKWYKKTEKPWPSWVGIALLTLVSMAIALPLKPCLSWICLVPWALLSVILVLSLLKTLKACVARLWKTNGVQLLWSKVMMALSPPRVWVAKRFWAISDYGYSTGRILWTFLLYTLVFAFAYTIWPSLLSTGAGQPPLGDYNGFCGFISYFPAHFPRMLFFAAASMVTLGFGNITAAQNNFWGMFAVVANLLTGYFLLAVLVTRFAVLFKTMAPGHVPQKDDLQPRN